MQKEYSFIDYLELQSKNLLMIKQKFFYMKAIDKRLNEFISDEGFYVISNRAIAELNQSVMDSLIVDFASWGSGTRKNFFNKIAASCLSDVKRYRFQTSDYPEGTTQYLNYKPTEEQIEEDKRRMKKNYFDRMNNGQKELIEELLPGFFNRKNCTVNAEDMKKLAEDLDDVMMRVFDDRDKYRAHKYEDDLEEGFKLVTLKEIETAFEGAENILNGLRLMVTAGSLAFDSIYQGMESGVKDMLDVVFYGGVWRKNTMMGVNGSISGKNDCRDHISEREKLLEAGYREYLVEANKKGEVPKKPFWKELYPDY